jgi:hypothetical protein
MQNINETGVEGLKVYGNTSGVLGIGVNFGVKGISNDYGVYGVGDDFGVYGKGYIGTYGESSESIGGIGVYGKGYTGGEGVYGEGPYGVVGHGTLYDFVGNSGKPSRVLGPMYSKCGSVHGNNVVRGSVFDSLSPAIPSTNDVIKITGGAGTSDTTPNIMTFSYAMRTSSTRITIYGIQNNTSNCINAHYYDSGDATTIFAISIAWG